MTQQNFSTEPTQHYSTTPFVPALSAPKRALQDICYGFKQWDVWFALAWQDIRLRYRRSTLGPFWITLSMGVTIFGMAFLYSYLFKIDTRAYFPYLASGMIIWNLFSLLITDGTQIFVESTNYLKQIKLPFTVFILRVIVRSFIIFFHNLIIIIPVMVCFHIKPTWALFFLIPGFFMIFLAAFCYIFILAIFGTRFRDVTQIVTSLVQIIFFATPIMWNASLLNGKHMYLVNFNPFYYFLELLRAPLLGNWPDLITLTVCSGMIIVGLIASFLLLIRVRARIIYWL